MATGYNQKRPTLLRETDYPIIQNIPGIKYERDFDSERRTILRSKINLKLLSTLGTTDVNRWLPNGVRRGRFFFIEEYMIAINTHSCRLIPDFYYHPKINDDIKNRLFLAIVGHIYVYTISEEICQEHQVLCIANETTLDLVQLYIIVKDIPEEVAIKELCDLFSISKDTFTMPKLDGRTRWYQNKRYINALNKHHIADYIGLSIGKMQAPCSHEYQYSGVVASCLGLIEKKVNQTVEKKTMLPITAWQKHGEIYYFSPLYLPFNGLQPLYNLHELCHKNEYHVLLTDSIEIAYSLHHLRCPNYVCVSWYGGKEAIPHVNWTYLENRRGVRYLLTNHSGQSAKNVFETAMVIINTLKSKGIIIEFEYYNLTNDPEFGHNWSAGFIPQYKVISEAQRLLADLTVDTPKEKATAKGSELKTIPSENIPEMRYIFYPAIPESSITLLYADTGVGKTWLALSVAFSVALGCKAYGKWKAESPRSVLYIDSEMDETSFQRRLQVMSQAYAGNDPQKIELLKKNFRWKSVKSDMLNIADESDQAIIDGYIKMARQENEHPVSLIVLDNLSTLTAFADSA